MTLITNLEQYTRTNKTLKSSICNEYLELVANMCCKFIQSELGFITKCCKVHGTYSWAIGLMEECAVGNYYTVLSYSGGS